MISIIGLMIGSYVQVRMLSFLTRKGEAEEAKSVKMAARINMVITGIFMLALLVSGK